jgi:type I restriction enzyme, S subunit
MEVKAGYKQTELGIIPDDWDVVPIASILERGTRITYGVVQPGRNVDDGVLFIRGGDIFAGKIDVGNLRKISHSISNNYKRTLLHGGEILISLVGYPGEAAIVPDSLAGANIARQAALIRLSKDKLISAEYVCDFLLSNMGKRLLLNETFGSAQQVINLKDINKLVVLLPREKTEQETIAEALSDADALIEALEQLLAKKRQVKQGAMQEFLTAKRRFPGFHEEWKWKTFGDVIYKCFSGATPSRSRSKYFKGNIRWITSTELNYNVITDTAEKITPEAVRNTNLKMLPKNTFLMAITGLEAEGTRGRCGIVGEEATSNQSCMALFPTNELLVKYLFHYYVYAGDRLAMEYCQGTKQQSYTAQTVKLLPIFLPPVPEQTAIAEILSDMDAEIAALEAKLAKARQVKQGMMQELLTGRVRLVSA